MESRLYCGFWVTVLRKSTAFILDLISFPLFTASAQSVTLGSATAIPESVPTGRAACPFSACTSQAGLDFACLSSEDCMCINQTLLAQCLTKIAGCTPAEAAGTEAGLVDRCQNRIEISSSSSSQTFQDISTPAPIQSRTSSGLVILPVSTGTGISGPLVSGGSAHNTSRVSASLVIAVSTSIGAVVLAVVLGTFLCLKRTRRRIFIPSFCR
ncbi:hypothetical protein C8Q79DRAFT_735276 [Trametes meyenii]|nr:hypothetical protein C8Q79DRAFT_735276 [Trametes meyenii]